MPIFYGKSTLMDYLKSIKTPHSTIGFVPTMGALHAGHLALMQKSLMENDNTVVSIFVNPTQFNNPEDLAKYPRTLDEDVKKLDALDTKIILYAPSVEDIYEGNVQSQSFDFDGLEKKTLKSMVLDVEKHAKNTNEQIDSEFIQYDVIYKASNSRK